MMKLFSRLAVGAATLAMALTAWTVPSHAVDASALPRITSATANDNPIVVENRQPGSAGWRIPWAGKSVATDRNMGVKGFASAVSVNQGESVGVRVHAASPGPATYDVYRLGWYQGLGGRLVTSGSFTAPRQPSCVTAMPEGLVTCPWSNTFTVQTNSTWTSGIYVVVLTRGTYQSYVPFVVRNDSRKGAIVHMQAIFTSQAYNMFPSDGVTGKSLYAYNSFGAPTVNGTAGAVKVSFDRPYWDAGTAFIMTDDAPLVRYEESRGFDVTYLTDLDLDRNPDLALGQTALVSAGHDEYWTAAMFSAAEAARDAGVNVAMLGANDIYWQVRLEPSATGDPDRVIVCYKDANLDPVKDATRTVKFRDLPRPEQPLIGQMWPTFDGTGMVKDDAPWVVRNSAHWLYRGSGLTDGSTIPDLVGVETDHRLADFPAPTLKSGTTLDVLAQSPYVTRYDGSGFQESTFYTAPSGAQVFSAGTLRYTRGLMGEGSYAQQSVRSVTTNLFSSFRGAALAAHVDRAAGPTRYETAVEVSRSSFATPQVPIVFVATGTTYPDALAASAASQGEGPILLVEQNAVPQSVADELGRLKPARVVVVGGTGAVSDATLSAISTASGVGAERFGGLDRYATAAEVSKRSFAPGVPVAYVATGLNFPDALAGGAAGAQLGGPVLLTGPTSLAKAAATELTRLAPRRIVVVGSSGVVTDSVVTALRGITPNVVRLGGADRFETALLVARDTHGAGHLGTLAVATGWAFPDALTAGPAVAASGGVLLLADKTLTPAAAEEAVRTDPGRVLVVGDTGVVSAAYEQALQSLYTSPSPAQATPVPALPAPSDNPTIPNAEQPMLSPLSASAGVSPEPGAPIEPSLPWLGLPTAQWQFDPASGN